MQIGHKKCRLQTHPDRKGSSRGNVYYVESRELDRPKIFKAGYCINQQKEC